MLLLWGRWGVSGMEMIEEAWDLNAEGETRGE